MTDRNRVAEFMWGLIVDKRQLVDYKQQLGKNKQVDLGKINNCYKELNETQRNNKTK